MRLFYLSINNIENKDFEKTSLSSMLFQSDRYKPRYADLILFYEEETNIFSLAGVLDKNSREIQVQFIERSICKEPALNIKNSTIIYDPDEPNMQISRLFKVPSGFRETITLKLLQNLIDRNNGKTLQFDTKLILEYISFLHGKTQIAPQPKDDIKINPIITNPNNFTYLIHSQLKIVPNKSISRSGINPVALTQLSALKLSDRIILLADQIYFIIKQNEAFDIITKFPLDEDLKSYIQSKTIVPNKLIHFYNDVISEQFKTKLFSLPEIINIIKNQIKDKLLKDGNNKTNEPTPMQPKDTETKDNTSVNESPIPQEEAEEINIKYYLPQNLQNIYDEIIKNKYKTSDALKAIKTLDNEAYKKAINDQNNDKSQERTELERLKAQLNQIQKSIEEFKHINHPLVFLEQNNTISEIINYIRNKANNNSDEIFSILKNGVFQKDCEKAIMEFECLPNKLEELRAKLVKIEEKIGEIDKHLIFPNKGKKTIEINTNISSARYFTVGEFYFENSCDIILNKERESVFWYYNKLYLFIFLEKSSYEIIQRTDSICYKFIPPEKEIYNRIKSDIKNLMKYSKIRAFLFAKSYNTHSVIFIDEIRCKDEEITKKYLNGRIKEITHFIADSIL